MGLDSAVGVQELHDYRAALALAAIEHNMASMGSFCTAPVESSIDVAALVVPPTSLLLACAMSTAVVLPAAESGRQVAVASCTPAEHGCCV